MTHSVLPLPPAESLIPPATVKEIRFWAIGDLHLSFARPRDLTYFSPLWANHVERLAQDWREKVQPEDVVLLLGDISWATTAKRVEPDLQWLTQFPGRKVLIRGNHDRWWVDIDRVRRYILPQGFYAIQGDCLNLEGVLLCGAQGHYAPNDPLYRPDPPHNRYERELKTLKSALKAAENVRQPDQPLIVLMHYPPYTSDGQATTYSELIEAHAPAMCLYGHIHHPHEWACAVNNEERNGVYYRLLAADYLQMSFQCVWSVKVTE